MASLREMLEKAKQEKARVNTSVLQPQAKQALPQETKPAEGTVHSQAGLLHKNSEPGPSANNSVLGKERSAENPPLGLSGMALARWKKEHANSALPPTNGAIAVSDVSVAASVLDAFDAKIPARPLTLAEKLKAKHANELTHTTHNIPARTEQPVSTNAAPAQNVVQNSLVHSPVPQSAGGTVDAETLRTNLDYLANNIEQKELVASVVRTIAVQIKQNPSLKHLMTDADVDLMVRGLRRSYGIVARKKTEDREKKASKKKGGEELLSALKDAGLEGLNDIQF